ncbi:uncharacterized protein A1O9_08545 [Exophiala aquamarina CBS 119918]|uniref:Uncharacterized protein n=1 Tax=Exophiala aquamarina CBS 119918 TaxID=1182545 RepID=A0A072P6S6_9EURO|nr:uncharacterized protein A1O9_08545 [Exophiala aquamarina CBS 119918]KEF55794.1 hypothetical protein A1O9_08545 [Exophiala aquamarina CBS 119918]
MTLYYTDNNALSDMVHWVNESTSLWRVAPLSYSWTFVDSGVPEEEWREGLADNATVFRWQSMSKVGGLPLNTFVYLMITIAVIIFLIWSGNVEKIILAVNRRHFNHAPNIHQASTEDHAFRRGLVRHYPPRSEEPPFLSHAETVENLRGADITSDDIRDCQSIIRKVYALKVDAYNARDAYAASQLLVAEMRRKENAGLTEIQSIVEEWASDQPQWKAEEWKKVCEIRNRMRAIPGLQPLPGTQFDTIEEARTR